MAREERSYHHDDRQHVGGIFATALVGSVPLFTASGVRVRMHASLPIFIAATLLFDRRDGYVLSHRLISMGALLILVIAHEFARCFATRVSGGDIDQVVLWPAGGLDAPPPPNRLSPSLISAVGPLLSNITTCITTAGIVWFLSGQWVSFNPFQPLPPTELMSHGRPVVYAWWLFVVSYDLWLINLLPIPLLDGGRVMLAILQPQLGLRKAANAVTVLGMIVSGILVIFGISQSFNILLIVLGLMLFVHCVWQRSIMREESAEEFSSREREPAFGFGVHDEEHPKRRRRVSRWKVRQLRRQARREEAEQVQLDLILAKVSARGLPSLKWRERRALKRATRRRREMELISQG